MCLSRLAFSILIWAATCGLANAQDIEGSQDHPITGRYEGSEITGYDHKDFDVFKLSEGDELSTTEGIVTQVAYRLPEGVSIAAASRNFEKRITEQGFEKTYTCVARAAESPCMRDLSYLVTRLPEPRMVVDAFTYQYDVFRAGGTTITVLTSINNSRVYVQASIVEGDELEFNMIDAKQIADGLLSDGKVALYGILFDTDSARIKPESAETLAALAQFLSESAETGILIVGHTDNQGALDYNKDLSKRRAEAVRDHLINTFTIAPDRLYADGVGFLAPVAPNATAEERALNRRVEVIAR